MSFRSYIFFRNYRAFSHSLPFFDSLDFLDSQALLFDSEAIAVFSLRRNDKVDIFGIQGDVEWCSEAFEDDSICADGCFADLVEVYSTWRPIGTDIFVAEELTRE